MKKIIKTTSPSWFEMWKHNFEIANGYVAHYKDDFAIDLNRRRTLRENLVKEQGKICCYCMGRITVDFSHIEHFWPKKHFGNVDMDYNNLFASCNGTNSYNVVNDDEYCGHRKDDWWNPEMVSPSDGEIENMFRYTVDGRIHSVEGRRTSHIAEEMIHNMGLDSYHLERNRREAIEESEVFDEEDYSDDDIRYFIDYYSSMNEGEYVPYCKAIIDCLIDYL